MGAARFWREIPNRYNLIGTRCGYCGKIFFPSRFICPQCRRIGGLEPYKLGGRGKIVSFTQVHVPPSGFEGQTPYALAVVELGEGPRVTTQITDCDPNQVEIGDEVEMVFRHMGDEGREGIIYYGYKARKVS